MYVAFHHAAVAWQALFARYLLSIISGAHLVFWRERALVRVNISRVYAV